MGEIADALRRAQARRTPVEPPMPPELPDADALSLRDTAPRADPSPRPSEPPVAGRVIDALVPADPAVSLHGGPSVEACRQVAVRIHAKLEGRGAVSAAVVSAVRDEGKTTVVCDLGLALASMINGRRVAIVDLDLRKPSIARVLGVAPDTGIEDVLRRKAALDAARISVRRPEIDLYPATEAQSEAHELLVLPSFAEMMRELVRRYAIVLVDTPPALLVPDTQLLLKHIDACIPVARAGQTRARPFRQMMETLPRRQVLGELLNGVRPARYSYGYYEHDEPRGDAGAPAAVTEAPAKR